MTPREGALLLLHDADFRLVLHLRDDRPDIPHPGRWSLFGGSIEPGETRRQAAAREWAEETGLVLPAASLIPFERIATGAPRHAHLNIFIHEGPVPGLSPDAIRLTEGAGFGFFTQRQVRGLELPSVLKPAVLRYLAYLTTEVPQLRV